jgi:hypothetical protein
MSLLTAVIPRSSDQESRGRWTFFRLCEYSELDIKGEGVFFLLLRKG